MDALPVMTERKKKIDMHLETASKVLKEIKRRNINNIQDWQDEVMNSSESISNQTKIDMFNYLKREIASPEEFIDKLRILVILV